MAMYQQGHVAFQLSGHAPVDGGEALPPVKWCGGKRKLLPAILPHVPSHFQAYHEPFVGGGALFFKLHALGRLSGGAVLSDANPHLIAAYRGIRDDVGGVIDALSTFTNSEAEYARLRALFNTGSVDALTHAALFIYLNKSCYAKITATSFTAYCVDDFTSDDQARLRDAALAAKRCGVHVLLSNSSAPAVYELYGGKEWTIEEVSARRNVNCKGGGRGPVKELLIESARY